MTSRANLNQKMEKVVAGPYMDVLRGLEDMERYDCNTDGRPSQQKRWTKGHCQRTADYSHTLSFNYIQK